MAESGRGYRWQQTVRPAAFNLKHQRLLWNSNPHGAEQLGTIRQAFGPGLNILLLHRQGSLLGTATGLTGNRTKLIAHPAIEPQLLRIAVLLFHGMQDACIVFQRRQRIGHMGKRRQHGLPIPGQRCLIIFLCLIAAGRQRTRLSQAGPPQIRLEGDIRSPQ